MPLFLKNPHSILAVLDTRPEDVYEVQLASASVGGVWDRVRSTAEDVGLPVQVMDGRSGPKRGGPGKRAGQSPGRTGGSGALVKERRGAPLEGLFVDVEGAARPGLLWLGLDGLQDPQNVGSIFRSAAFFGVRGVLLTRDRSAPLSATVYDVASGGLEYVPFSIHGNLNRALTFAKERGLWILGTSEHAELSLEEVDRHRPWLLVLGNEERGLRRLTLERCDTVCRITPRGRMATLNVSVAAGILMQRLSEQ